jgi:hypothetical protein
MNQSYNRDIKYSFLKRCVKPINAFLIDDEWVKEKNIEMEIIIPFKNLDRLDDDILKNGNELSTWNDNGLEELLGRNLHQSDLNFR